MFFKTATYDIMYLRAIDVAQRIYAGVEMERDCQEYTVEDISRSVIEYSITHKMPITNLRLQRLLYFLQGFRLLETKGRNGLFKESVLAWPNGPVVRESYFLFDRFGSEPITDYISASTLKFENGRFRFVDTRWTNPLSSRDKEFISKVVEGFSSISDSRLVGISRDPQGPWAKNYQPNESNIVPRKEIYNYFIEKTK